MKHPAQEERRFPRIDWAWPSGDLDLLLRAAVHPETSVARGAFEHWLSVHGLDDATWRDHRLLVGITARFGKAGLSHLAEFPRLVGLQRQLWTRSRMAFAENMPVIAAPAASNIPVMLLKGGARIAADPAALGTRLAHDLDILVPSAQTGAALEALFALGWRPTTGESRLALQARASRLRSVNFQHGRFGDVDLHRLGMGFDSPLVDQGLWHNARSGDILGQQVFYPDPAGLLATSIWHSARDAHVHSDWIVDCARTIARGDIDWDGFLSLVKAGNCALAALVALSYLAGPLDCDVPADVLAALERSAPVGLARVPLLLEARPRSQWSPPVKLARGIVKQVRLATNRRHETTARPLFLRYAGRQARIDGAPPPRMLDLPLGEIAGAERNYRLEVTVATTLPDLARRVCLELNTARGHLATLRYNSVFRPKGAILLSFATTLRLSEGVAGPLWLASRPARYLRPTATQDEIAHYAALPIGLVSLRLRPLRPLR